MTAAHTDLVSPTDLARELGVSAQTLAIWRLKGTGPKFCKLGSRIGYRRSAVDAWLDERTRGSTSDHGPRRKMVANAR